MTRFRALVLPFAIMAVYSARGVPLDAQTKTPASQSASISVSLSFKRMSLRDPPPDPRPWAIVTVKNIGNRNVALRTDMSDYRVHVEGEKGEAPKTSFHRSIRGEFQPGDTALAGGGVVDDIPPGESDVHKFDLTKFYDLKVSGKYTVYVEVQDELSGTWLRTNTVQFTMQASNH
jgi:hypothetical protein